MTSLALKIQSICKDRINSYDKALAKNQNDNQVLYERAQAKFFLAMVAGWKDGNDAALTNDVTKDLYTAFEHAPVDRKDEYKKAYDFATM
jgi:hypothetical protein